MIMQIQSGTMNRENINLTEILIGSRGILDEKKSR